MRKDYFTVGGLAMKKVKKSLIFVIVLFSINTIAPIDSVATFSQYVHDVGW